MVDWGALTPRQQAWIEEQSKRPVPQFVRKMAAEDRASRAPREVSQ